MIIRNHMSKDLKKPFIPFILISLSLLYACQLEEHQEKEIGNPVSSVPAKMYAGSPDLPENEKQITSAGIGKIILGDPLNKVDRLYDSVVNLTLYKEGGEWLAKKVLFDNDQWILAESVKSVDQITGIYTNYKEFKTKDGYHVGMRVDSIHHQKDSIVVDRSQKAFFLYKSGIFFKIDPDSEKKYFKSTSFSFEKDSTLKLDQFFIICGDC